MSKLKNMMMVSMFVIMSFSKFINASDITELSQSMEIDDYSVIGADLAISLAKEHIFEGSDSTLDNFFEAVRSELCMLSCSSSGLYISVDKLLNLAEKYHNCHYTRAKWSNFIEEVKSQAVVAPDNNTTDNNRRTIALSDGIKNFIEEYVADVVSNVSSNGSEYVYWINCNELENNIVNFKKFLILKFSNYLDQQLDN